MAGNCCGVLRDAVAPSAASLLVLPPRVTPAEEINPHKNNQDHLCSTSPGRKRAQFEDVLAGLLRNVQRELAIEHRKALDEQPGQLRQGAQARQQSPGAFERQQSSNRSNRTTDSNAQYNFSQIGFSSINEADATASIASRTWLEAPRKQDAEVQTEMDWSGDQPMLPTVNRLSLVSTNCETFEEEKKIVDATPPTRQISGASKISGASREENEAKQIKRAPSINHHMLGVVPREHDINIFAFKHGDSSWKKRLEKLSLDAIVKVTISIVVITNVFVLGAEAAYHHDGSGWLIVDTVYAVLFLSEVVYKVVRRGIFIFCPGHRNWLWNLFDLALSGMATIEVTIGFLDVPIKSNGVAAVRSMRLIRITRVFKLIPAEMRSVFSDLMMMMDGVTAGIRTLFWSIVLMALPVYVFSLILCETLGAKNASRGEIGWEFNTMSRSMFTAWRCLVGGDCAAMNGTPLFPHVVEEHGWFFGVLFCFTQVCMSFGLFNVIASVYVENVIAHAKNHDHLQHERRLKDKKKMSDKSIELIFLLWSEVQNANKSRPSFTAGKFDLQEAMQLVIHKTVFDSVTVQSRAQIVLHDLELPPEEYESLFEVFDADGGGTLTIEEILQGIKELRGNPRRSDVVSIALRMRSVQEQLKRVEADVAVLKPQAFVVN